MGEAHEIDRGEDPRPSPSGGADEFRTIEGDAAELDRNIASEVESAYDM